MGRRKWGILVRSHEDLKRVLDVAALHNEMAAAACATANATGDFDAVDEFGEEVEAVAVLRFRGAVYVALSAGGGGTQITNFLYPRLPLAIFEPWMKPDDWSECEDYLWQAKTLKDDLRRDFVPGTALYSTLSTAFADADPDPVSWSPYLFSKNDKGPKRAGSSVNEGFEAVLEISERYFEGKGVSFRLRRTVDQAPWVADFTAEYAELTRRGFAFYFTTDHEGVRTPTERRRGAYVQFLCRDAAARDVAAALFEHPGLGMDATMSDQSLINNLPDLEVGDSGNLVCPVLQQSVGVQRGAGSSEAGETRWVTVD